MDIILLAARLLIAAVFMVAGFAKLADRKGSQQTLIDFGVPERSAKSFGVILPLFEITIAISLIPVTSVWWGAVLAFTLFLSFIIVISINLIKGKTPECHCFGQLHSKPIGWSTLIRNIVLAAIAAFIVMQGQNQVGLSAFAWFGDLTQVERIIFVISIIIFSLLIVEGWLLINLMRQNGRLLLRMDALEAYIAPSQSGLAVGDLAPSFQLEDLYGRKITLESLLADKLPVVLIFWDPNCRPCAALLPEISRWHREYASLLSFTLLSKGNSELNRVTMETSGITRMLLQNDGEVAKAYKVRATPAAVFVRSDGRIGSPPAMGVDAIKALVTRLAATIQASMSVAVEDNGHD